MLLDIRETIRNSKPIKYTLITIITIPFALVGIGSYLGGGGYNNVAEVNGVEISEQQLDSTYNMLKSQFQARLGGSIPEGALPDELIREQALEQLVQNQVIRSAVEDQKFAVGDVTLGRTIRNNPQFQTDGQFDTELYQNVLQTRYSNIASFEESMRQETAISQFESGVLGTSFQLPSESSRITELRNQTRTIDFVRYSIDDAIENTEVSDEAVTAYYDENAESFKFPQRAKLEYIELKKADLAAAVEIDDVAVTDHYEQFKNNYMLSPETRDASHILLELDDGGDTEEVAEKTAQLVAIKERIAGGESFADLAKEFSNDIGSAQAGGALGQIQRGVMAPDFEQSVFGLGAVDDVSDIVQTQFGLHLIKLDRLEIGEYKPFDDVKDDIRTELQDREADPEYLQLRVAMEESVASDPESLSVAADESNVEIQTSDWVDSETLDHPLFSNPQIQRVIFSDELLVDQYNSDVIEVAPGHLVAVRIQEYEEPRPQAIEDVREDVVGTLKRQDAEAQLDTLVEEAVAKMIKGTAATSLAKDDDLASGVMDEVLTRQSTVIDNTVVAEIYALAKPSEGKTLVKSASLQNGDRVAYALKAVETPEPAADAAETPEPPIGNPRLGRIEFAAMIASLREKADVSLSE